MTDPRLSIVISTRNRAAFIGETLDSILPQLTPQTELVVFDGASTDATPTLLAEYAARHPALRYIRAPINSGVDADYDNAVGEARGDYVWLFADDDILLPAAVARVVELLDRNVDLIVVDAEVRDRSLARTLDPRRLAFTGERRYTSADTDRLMADAGNALSFIGGTIIRRALWLARDRERFYGSLFVHVGVIFQAPLSAVVLGASLIAIRVGNESWTSRSVEIWAFLWPELIWKIAVTKQAKARVIAREPWRGFRYLIFSRAGGALTPASYRRFFAGRRLGAWRVVLWTIAHAPGRLINVVALLGLRVRGHAGGAGGYVLTQASPFSNAVSRRLAA